MKKIITAFLLASLLFAAKIKADDSFGSSVGGAILGSVFATTLMQAATGNNSSSDTDSIENRLKIMANTIALEIEKLKNSFSEKIKNEVENLKENLSEKIKNIHEKINDMKDQIKELSDKIEKMEEKIRNNSDNEENG